MVKREPCETHIGHSGHVHTNTDILKPHIYFFILIHVDRISLNRFGEQFKNDTVTVTGFPGFALTEGGFE